MNQHERDLVVKVLNMFADKLNIISGSLELLNYEVTKEEYAELAKFLMFPPEPLTLDTVTNKFIAIKSYSIDKVDFEDMKKTVRRLLLGLKNEEIFEDVIEKILN